MATEKHRSPLAPASACLVFTEDRLRPQILFTAEAQQQYIGFIVSHIAMPVAGG